MKESTKATLWIGGTLLVIGGGAAIIAVQANKTAPTGSSGGSPGGGQPPSSGTPPGSSDGGTQQPPSTSGGTVTGGFPVTPKDTLADLVNDSTVTIMAYGQNMNVEGPDNSAFRTDGLLGGVNVMKGDLKVLNARWLRGGHKIFFTITGTQGEVLVLWSDENTGTKHSTTIKVMNGLLFPPGTFQVGLHV